MNFFKKSAFGFTLCLSLGLTQTLPALAQEPVSPAYLVIGPDFYPTVASDITSTTDGVNMNPEVESNNISLHPTGTIHPQPDGSYLLNVSIDVSNLPEIALLAFGRDTTGNIEDIQFKEEVTAADFTIDVKESGNFNIGIYITEKGATENAGTMIFEIPVDISGLKLMDYVQPGASYVINDNGKTATISIDPVSDAVYQWQYKTAIYEDESMSIIQEEGAFTDIPSANAPELITNGLEGSQGYFNEGKLYRCRVSTAAGTTYSRSIMMPVKNKWTKLEQAYKVEQSQILKVLAQKNEAEEYLYFADLIGIEAQYLLDYPKTHENPGDAYAGYPGIYFTADYGFVDKNATTSSSTTIFNRMKDVNTYHIVANVKPTGIYSGLTAKIAIDVVPDGALGEGGSGGSGDIPGSVPVFYDVPDGVWYTTWCQKAAQMGLMMGTDGYFRPDDDLNRGELALILYRLAGEPDFVPTKAFPDVNNPNDYFYKAVLWAGSLGIVTGYTEGQYAGHFFPGDTVTREQLVAMIARYANIVGDLNTSTGANISVYPDYSQVSGYARQPFSWCVAQQILSGQDINGTYYLAPLLGTKRAEAAKMLVNFSQILTDNEIPNEQ